MHSKTRCLKEKNKHSSETEYFGLLNSHIKKLLSDKYNVE